MEASGTPTPPPEPAVGRRAAAARRPDRTGEERPAGAGARSASCSHSRSLFACAVMIVAMIEIADTPLRRRLRAEACRPAASASTAPSAQKTIASCSGSPAEPGRASPR